MYYLSSEKCLYCDALQKADYSLRNIKAIVDAVDEGRIKVTEKSCLDFFNHRYGIDNILALIRNHTCQGLGLPIPERKEVK